MLSALKVLRKEYDVSQRALAKEIGITQQSINSFENREVDPSISVLMKLADYFNTSVDYIVGRTDIRRRIEKVEAYELNEREAAVVERYRTLSEKEKQCVDLMIQTLAER